jgi:hypothetical protein
MPPSEKAAQAMNVIFLSESGVLNTLTISESNSTGRELLVILFAILPEARQKKKKKLTSDVT